MAYSRVLYFCVQSLLLGVAFSKAFTLPSGTISPESNAMLNNIMANGNLFGTGANGLAGLPNLRSNEIVANFPGNSMNEVISTNNIIPTKCNGLANLPSVGVNEIVTSNKLANNFNGFSGNFKPILTGLPNFGINEIVSTNNGLSNVGFNNVLAGNAINTGFANNIFSNNLVPMSGNLLNSEIVLSNNASPFANVPVTKVTQPIISELIPNLQVGDLTLTGDLPIGGSIKVMGSFPVYGVIAVDGSVPSSGTAVVNTAGNFVVEPGTGCLCANQVL